MATMKRAQERRIRRQPYVEGNAARQLEEPARRSASGKAGRIRRSGAKNAPARETAQGSGKSRGKKNTSAVRVRGVRNRAAGKSGAQQAFKSQKARAVREAAPVRRGAARTGRSAADRRHVRASSQERLGAVSRAKPVSLQTKKNRARALNINRGFVVFLAVMSVAVSACCIHYLQLKSVYTAKMRAVAGLESELAQIKEDNDAYYSEVSSDIDLNRIKQIAIGRLGMRYPSDGQIESYTTQEGGFVRQYQVVEESK